MHNTITQEQLENEWFTTKDLAECLIALSEEVETLKARIDVLEAGNAR